MGCYKIPSPCVSVISFICIVLSVLQALYSWCSNYFRSRRRAFFFQTLKLRLKEATWWSGSGMTKRDGILSTDLKHQSTGFRYWGVKAGMPWIFNLEVLICKISCCSHCPGRWLSVLINHVTMSRFNSFLECKIEITKYPPYGVALNIKWLHLYKTLWIVPGT